jgi:hypothetical protein
MLHMHKRAPTYFSRAVGDVLGNALHDQWIGRGGPTAWPPCPPDLNPLDLYLWGHLTTLVYATPLAVWMPVRLSASTPAFLYECGGP